MTGRVASDAGMIRAALLDARPVPYWLDDSARPPALPPLVGNHRCDLLVVGGGYTGLWTALLAKQRDPGRDVLLVEGGRCGDAASGRNGGFVDPSLTHGFDNGAARWPRELQTLIRLGRANLDAIEQVVREHDIDCALERNGGLLVATEEYQLDEHADSAERMAAAGVPAQMLSADEVRARVDSPTYLGALLEPEIALVEPAALAWGLRRVCREAGVRIFEHSPVRSLRRQRSRIEVTTRQASVTADSVALATNAYPPLLRRLRLMSVPVYDYALMTEPLTAAQLAAVGWSGREGIGDSGNQFHYYRLSRDNRILFGGYDAIYHYGSRMQLRLEQRAATFELLARHFFETFPQLAGLRFSHRWGGVIDTSTRFCAYFGSALGRRVAYAAGFTGLGVAASRFAGEVMLDLLAGEETERTSLAMVRERPLPFPPEPLRYAGIQATRWSLAAADRQQGRSNLWLRTLERLGLGFDS